MKNEPERDTEKAELSLLKLLYPEIYGEHEVCQMCEIIKSAVDATYPLAQLIKIGNNYYCLEHVPPLPLSEDATS